MQVQSFYSTHSTSSTIELREPEIESLAHVIHDAIENDQGFVSATILSRFDDYQSFPRLPFEPCSLEEYQRRLAKVDTSTFYERLLQYDVDISSEEGPVGCDSTHCILKELPR